ncbi:MAG: phosphate ABC transporter substrate-binding protein [Elusimicrobiota bacterium]|nr:phosphate ABC transporter substrate-binding protein [Elusimicrobiota bacterium]
MTFFFLFVVLFISCARPTKTSQSIQIKGSDTMVNLVQAWAEEFMKINPEKSIAVTGGGSGIGIAALLDGTCDIAESSRKMTSKELELAKLKRIQVKEFIVGYDGIAVVVHPSNPVEKLTIAQLSDIFTGRITNWKYLGGKDRKIVLLSREVNSGTHVYFKEQVLSGKEFSPEALLVPSSQAIADEVAQNHQAIGYFGMGYISKSQKVIAIASQEDGKYYMPTKENIINKKYPISRPLFMYTRVEKGGERGEPKGLVKEFIDFVLSPDGQKLVTELDFVPLQ